MYKPEDTLTISPKALHLYAFFKAAPDLEKPDDWLNKEDHFAYIIGYPDGMVRLTENITRAEVATICLSYRHMQQIYYKSRVFKAFRLPKVLQEIIRQDCQTKNAVSLWETAFFCFYEIFV